MKVLRFFIAINLLAVFSTAQVKIELNPTTPAINIGGVKGQEQIVKYQLLIADAFTRVEEKEVSIYFTVTKDGKVMDPFFKDKYADFYQNEMKRLVRYFIFEPAKIGERLVDAYGSLTVKFNGPVYKGWLKERNKPKLNLSDKPADTTFVIYDNADKSPEYVKGDDALPSFLLENIEYPSVAKMQTIEGTVILTFIVEPNGFVSNVKSIRNVNGGCTEEAIRVMNLVRFKPAEKNGKYVRYKMQYPITFSLKNINKDASNSQ